MKFRGAAIYENKEVMFENWAHLFLKKLDDATISDLKIALKKKIQNIQNFYLSKKTINIDCEYHTIYKNKYQRKENNNDYNKINKNKWT